MSPQICDLVKQIYFKNMNVSGFISLSDTEWQLVLTICVLIEAHFLKSAFKAFSVEWAKFEQFTKQNCSTETDTLIHNFGKGIF